MHSVTIKTTAIIVNILLTKAAVPLSVPFLSLKKNDKIVMVRQISISLKSVILESMVVFGL